MWKCTRKSNPAGFPETFKVQRIGIPGANALCELSAGEIANHFSEHPETAIALMHESYDKRFTPSTFIEEQERGFRVGWFTRQAKRECVQEFSDLADAATDYLLFSLGRGRWTPPGHEPGAPPSTSSTSF
jgi:hypothetical protein